MLTIKTAEEIEILRENAILVSKTLAVVGREIAPGVTTAHLNKVGEEYIRGNGAIPGFLNYEGYPYSLCISVNDMVVHGFPSKYELKEGDIVSVDCGTIYKGFTGDSAYTFPVGEVSPQVAKLLETTKESLYRGVAAARVGNRIGDIGYAVQSYCEAAGFSIVRDLVGHGIGRTMHEDPMVPNYGHAGRGKKLTDGMVICIEPMINMGKKDVYVERNGWGIRTVDGKCSAHYEFMVAIRTTGPEILTTYDYIQNIKNL